VLTAGAKPFRTQRAPIWTGGAVPAVTAPSGPWTAIFDKTPVAGQVEIVSDTGEIIFFAVPAAGNLNITYQAFRFSDQQIKDCLLYTSPSPRD